MKFVRKIPPSNDHQITRISVSKILRQFMPTFCWQTQIEVIEFVRRVRPTASASLIIGVLSQLHKKGLLRRQVKYDGARELKEWKKAA